MATKKSNSIDGKEKPIEEFDEISEDKLKSLLDEAMGYKSPPDAIDKSDMFQQLLKSAKEEEARQNTLYDSDSFFGLKQSNSLQNLQDEHYHTQMSSHQVYSSSKKHHRRKNNATSSVSTRRLEGGSLPVDMHHSLNDQPFLSEFRNNNKKRKEKFFKETVIDISDSCDDDRKLMQRSFDSTMKDVRVAQYQMDDFIEMKSVSYTNSVDLEVQDQSKYSSAPQPITTILTMRNNEGSSSMNKMSNDSSNAIDKTIQFSSLMEKPSLIQQQFHIDYHSTGSAINHNNIVVANPGLSRSVDAPVPLSSVYPSVASLTSEKSTIQKGYKSEAPMIAPFLSSPMQHGMSMNTSNNTQKELKTGKSKKKDTSKNEKVINAEQIIGNQGHKDVDELLKFIEDGGDCEVKNKKNNSRNGILTSDFLSSDDKKKKMSSHKEEKVNKLKKSNSCEELTSAGRQKQQGDKDKISTEAANKNFNEVTLRSKSGVNPSSGAKKGDNKSDQSQAKRNERRSWGNEGLRTESNADPQEIDSSSSCCSHQSETHVVESLSAGEQSLPVDEFQTVIKKRKIKRKSSEAGEMSKTNVQHLQTYKRDGKFTEGSIRPSGMRNNSERENKNSKSGKSHNQESKATKSRRKSTSSMPPSEDEYSDGNDSVQSLPIETTKTTSSQLLNERKRDCKLQQQQQQQQQNSQQQSKPATFSYADIAKTNATRHNSSGSNGNNGGMTPSIDKWPSITASSVSSHQNSNVISNTSNNDPYSLANSTETVKNQPQLQQQQHVQKPTASSILTKKLSYPELVESNNNKNKQLSSLSNSDVNVNVAKVTKQLNGGVESFDTNNNTDNQKISYSQSLLDSSVGEFTDANGNNVVNSKVDTKSMLTKSKSVDQNHLTSIDQYPALERTQTASSTLKVDKINKSVTAKPQPQPQPQQQQQQPVKVIDIKQTKKLKKSASIQQPLSTNNAMTPSSCSSWSAATAAPVASNCRPAVIILNDCVKPNEVDCGITFGFDINEHLLFGHQTNGDAGAEEKGTCTTDISLETNNNNNCDITNTNLSNNLNNQIAPAESYENFTQTKHINESHANISSQSSSLSLLSPSQQNQQQLQNINNVLDSSNQSSNDNGYLSSSLITTNSANSSPPLPAAKNNNNDMRTMFMNDHSTSESSISSSERMRKTQVKIDLPHFRSPQPTKFKNQDELVTFVSGEWTKVMRNGKFFECQ